MMQYIKQCFNLVNKRNIFPEYVTFFITNSCNARCRHCFYWQNLNSSAKDLSCDEIEMTSHNMDSFLFLLITGGEPFLRKDIPEIASIFYRRNNIKKLAIATNGYFVENIEKSIEEILKKCPKLQLMLNISLDGIGEDHDEIRGVRGMFIKTVDTVKVIRKLQGHYPDLLLSVIYTFSNLNQDRAREDYQYIKKIIKPNYFNLSLVRGNTRDPNINIGDLTLYNNLWKEVKKDIITSRLRQSVISRLLCAARVVAKDLVVKTLVEDKYITPCYAGKTNVVIYPDGDVFPCELLKDKIGNLREENYDFRRIWFSVKFKKIRREIEERRCYCYHGCNALTNVLYNPKHLPKIAINYIKQYFYQ
ncbi:MAG: radical SAM protein [Candidatus Omnitrophota bacterium]